jgi:iron complex transport system ATP-binding protein
MAVPLVSLRGVSKRWAARLAVRGIDLDIGIGEFVGLIGPNGAGKTTLLRMMAKLLEATGGALSLDGRALSMLSQRAVAKEVALVPQTAPVDFAFSALDVVLMGRHPHIGRFGAESPEDRRIAREAMALTGTTAFTERLMTELSSGERQRVTVARAVAQRPRLLLLDELTANLDLRHQVHVLGCVRRLVREAELSAVAAVHDLELASRYCERLVLLSDGGIVADGRPEEVLTPDRLQKVFSVTAEVKRHPITGGLSITVLDALAEGGATA